MSDGKLAVLHQRHRCVYHGRQFGCFGVTSVSLRRKENSVRHQIRFHSGVGASLHQRNIAAFSPAAFAARHRFFPSCRIHRQRRGKCLPKNCPKKAISGMKKCPCKLLVKEENRRKATLVAGKKPNEKSQIV
jgi:hypothetical protein